MFAKKIQEVMKKHRVLTGAIAAMALVRFQVVLVSCVDGEWRTFAFFSQPDAVARPHDQH